MPASTDIKPAFGQVWRYGTADTLFLLLCRIDEDEGRWLVAFIHKSGHVNPTGGTGMPGLFDDPAKRLKGYELLSEAE